MVNGKPFHYIMKSGHEHVQLHKIIQEQKKSNPRADILILWPNQSFVLILYQKHNTLYL